MSARHWTPIEMDSLRRAAAGEITITEMVGELPRRTAHQIRKRMRDFKFVTPADQCPHEAAARRDAELGCASMARALAATGRRYA